MMSKYYNRNISLIKKRGSLKDNHPEIASTWVSVNKGDDRYTPENTLSQSHLRVNWQCSDVEYHRWDQLVCRRVNHQKCPFCSGQKVHINDSYYTHLKKEKLLNYLDISEHEKAKKILISSNNISLLHACKTCKVVSYRNPKVFIHISEGCSKCRSVKQEKSRRLGDINKHGTISDNPNLRDEYCYDQKDIPPEYKNSEPPNEMNLNSTKCVWWKCKHGHFTASAVYIRQRGHICNKCSSQSSFLEIVIFKHLEKILGTQEVEFRGLINGFESDCILKKNKTAIEIDGLYYHKNSKSIKKDLEKNYVFKKEGYSIIRIRENGLPNILETDVIINYEKKYVNHYSYKKIHILEIINQILSYINVENIASLSSMVEAEDFYNSSRSIQPSKSVARTHPHLLKEVEDESTLLNFSSGSDHKIQWLCPKCSHKWKACISKRTSKRKPSGCPGCTGQAVTKSNCIATLIPEIQEAFVNKEEAKKVTLGSGKRLMFKCTFKNCSAEHKSRAVKDVVKQYRKHNHCYFNDCHHK